MNDEEWPEGFPEEFKRWMLSMPPAQRRKIIDEYEVDLALGAARLWTGDEFTDLIERIVAVASLRAAIARVEAMESGDATAVPRFREIVFQVPERLTARLHEIEGEGMFDT